jgi:hypothetical protein
MRRSRARAALLRLFLYRALFCSGEVFYELAKAEMPAKLLRSYTGTRFAVKERVPKCLGTQAIT